VKNCLLRIAFLQVSQKGKGVDPIFINVRDYLFVKC